MQLGEFIDDCGPARPLTGETVGGIVWRMITLARRRRLVNLRLA